jgi:hypothetical protein
MIIPYYKTKSTAYIMGLPYFGTKDSIKFNIEKSMFLNKELKRPSREELRKTYEKNVLEDYEEVF